MMFYLFFFSSYGLREILSLTPSASGTSSFAISLSSKKKLIFELFLKGIFMIFLEGIFMILKPVFWFTISFKQMILGTYPLLVIGMERGMSSSTIRVRVPLISVETSS